MTDELKVTVCEWGPGRPLMLRWTDPATGKRRTKSAGTESRREALKLAGQLESELRSGQYAPPSKATWQDFTLAYTEQVVSGLAAKTRAQLLTVFNAVERVCSPRRPADLTAARLSNFSATLLKEGKSPFTIKSYLAHLRASLRWAVDVGLLAALPKFPKTQRAKAGAKKMKGRAITLEEFERLLAVVPKVLSGQDKPRRSKRAEAPEAIPEAVESWRRFLRGLWWSGLRLRESLELSWDRAAGLSVDLSGRFPMLRIRGDSQKSARDQLHPVAPEFGEMLLATPEGERRGRVFKLLGVGKPGSKGGLRPVSNPEYVSACVTRMGKAARVVVDERTKRDADGKPRKVVKYASAHDLRRAFGTRWAKRIMPPRLRELMRHSDIQTTMAYYVGQDADDTAGALWEAYQRAGAGDGPGVGNTFGNTPAPEARIGSPRNDTSP